MIRIVSWNMARSIACWAALNEVPADIALVQEAGRPDPSWANALGDSPIPTCETALVAGRGPWRTAVLRLSDAVELQARPTVTLETATSVDDRVVSRAGSWPQEFPPDSLACPPFTTLASRHRPQPDNWTSCSPRRPWPNTSTVRALNQPDQWGIQRPLPRGNRRQHLTASDGPEIARRAVVSESLRLELRLDGLNAGW